MFRIILEVLVYELYSYCIIWDQPFTRSGGVVPLNPDELVYIRGHMNKLGYVGDIFVGSVAKGFKKVEHIPDLPKYLESQKPLPDGCAF